MSAHPHCAVVIPSFNGAHLLSTCLESLFAHPPVNCDWRVIVVDDASSDGTVDRFSGDGERVEVVARERNGGFAETCNDGAAAADDVDFLVFLNNDTIALAGWLDALVEEAAAYPEAAAVGSRLLYPDGTIQHAGVAIGQDRRPYNLYAGFPGEHPAVVRPKRVIAATGACLLVRRGVFDALGGFDRAFHNGFEDIDFCLKAGEAGHPTRYCPTSVLYHLESVTRWAEGPVRHVTPNDVLYDQRWAGRVVPDDFDHYLEDGLITVRYGPVYPVRISVSPLLATVERADGPNERLEQLLTERSAQVAELQGKRTRELLKGAPEPRPALRSLEEQPRTGGTPEVVNAGEFHCLGSNPAAHRVSVFMPLMDAAETLRRSLPVMLRQRADAELQIVGVDSASRDDSIDVLREFGAKVLTIDPAQFDHGLTRNLAATHADGDVLVFLNGRSVPCDENWLAPLLDALDADPAVAGVCSRVLPYPDADPLSRHDGEVEASGQGERVVKVITDWDIYREMPVPERRLLYNFHTVSAAIRADVLREIPFRAVRTIGEDLLWAREVLEAGRALVHEPGSRVYHSHNYTLREWFMRNVDDGAANNEVNGRELSEPEADALCRALIDADWNYLAELGLEEDELEHWRVQAALRRAAQVSGQWLGINSDRYPPAVLTAFSRVANSRRSS
jgi:GT2 family glycosyltransferase